MKKVLIVTVLSLLITASFSLTLADPPASSGAVLRIPDGFAVGFIWIFNGRMATIGLNVNEFCVNDTPEWDFVDLNLVILDDRWLTNATMDDARTEVYPIVGDIPGGDLLIDEKLALGDYPGFKAIVCGIFDNAGGNPLAVGNVDVQIAQNDALGTGHQAVYAETWMAHGSVMTTAGQLVSFQGQHNCRWMDEISCNVQFHLGRGK